MDFSYLGYGLLIDPAVLVIARLVQHYLVINSDI